MSVERPLPDADDAPAEQVVRRPAGPLVLGGDLGGTSTRIVVADSEGNVIGRGAAAGGNPTSHPASAAANFGQANRTFSQGDFNYDGTVNLADFNILASKFGTVLASAPGATGFASEGENDEPADELLA